MRRREKEREGEARHCESPCTLFIQRPYTSLGNIKHAKVLAQDLHLQQHFARRLTENLFPFLQVFGEDVEVVEARSGVHVEGEGSELPVAVGGPHIAGQFMEAGSFGEVSDPVGQEVVGAGGVVETPDFQDDLGPE